MLALWGLRWNKEHPLNCSMVYQRFQEPSALNLAVFVLTLYVLGALMVDTFWTLPSELSRLIRLFGAYTAYVASVFVRETRNG